MSWKNFRSKALFSAASAALALGCATNAAAVAAVTTPAGYCYQIGAGTSCDLPRATVSTSTTAAFGHATLTYFLFIPSSSFDSVPVHMEAALLASERLDGSAVPFFYGDYPKYDVSAYFNLGTSGFEIGNPGLVHAGIGAAGTRSGVDGSDVGGQFGYTQPVTAVRSVSPDGQHVVQTAWVNVDTTVMLMTNTVYTVQIGASVNGYYNSPGSLISSAYAYADPFFEIDAGFLAENPLAASISLSAGVANLPVAQVPEPTPTILFALGGLALGLWRRRRLRD